MGIIQDISRRRDSEVRLRRSEELLRATTRFHKLDHHSKVPVTTPVGKPETIGADRLALVVAAVTLFPGKNNLVIGLGSACGIHILEKAAA